MINLTSHNYKNIILNLLFLIFIFPFNLYSEELPKTCEGNRYSTPCLLELHQQNLVKFSKIIINQQLSSRDTNAKLLLDDLMDVNTRNSEIVSEINNYYFLGKLITDKEKYIEFQNWLRIMKIFKSGQVDSEIEMFRDNLKFTKNDKKLEKLFLLNIENLKQTALILKNSDHF